jgi:hypothetical protein
MATIEVSTWAQLVSAITNSAANNDTIKLIADINCNDEIPEGVASSIIPNATQGLTIDGSYQEGNVTKNHVIINLRTSVLSPQAIFKWKFELSSTTKTFNIKNIDFINLILDAPLIAHQQCSSGTNQTVIRNCRFTGRRTDYLYSPTSNNQGSQRAYFYSCYFNIPYYGTSYTKSPLCAFNSDTPTIRTYAHYCRFKETYTGTWSPTTTTEAVCCGVSNTWINGCRVEGTIVNGYSVYFHLTAVKNLDTPAMQNVYDVDFKLTSNDSENVVIQALKGVVKIPVRKYSDNTPYDVSSYSTGVIPATESQMQDTDWLIQHNFDVVPSNT